MKALRYISPVLAVVIVIAIVLVALPYYFNREARWLDDETRLLAPGDFIGLSQGLTHYEDVGPRSAQTIVLVHGFSVPYYIWTPTFNALVAKGYRVIRYDLYGRGYSARPELEYNPALFTQQIDDLLQALDVPVPIHIAGLSMGGSIATEFAVTHPGKVDKVILVDPSHNTVDPSVLAWPLIGEYIMNVLIAPSMASSQIADFHRPERHPDWGEKFEVQMQYKGFKRAILSTIRHYGTEDKLIVYTQLGKLNKPVMLIWGKEDQAVPYSGNERLRAVIETEFVGVDDAGHLPHYEKANLVNARIMSFLDR
jgi:pimeloyl-ACP methyl ester carboxylesterase